MTAREPADHLQDLEPSRATFLADVLHGLRRKPAQLPPKYFYDDAGSRLFDRICELPEYYLTRTELTIMERDAADMAAALGSRCLLLEPGSGNSRKTRLLLDNMHEPAGYVPVEISRDHMMESVRALQADHPALPIHPICADFTRPFTLPAAIREARPRCVYFPGSTIGNFPPAESVRLLRGFHDLAGSGGTLLLGMDLRKDPRILIPAYNDSAGVTAAFNRNLLVRINRELGADFEVARFRHRATWNDGESRMEMRLVSDSAQHVTIAGERFRFEAGESLITEYSYKHSPEHLHGLAREAGFTLERQWTDDLDWFGVMLLRRTDG